MSPDLTAGKSTSLQLMTSSFHATSQQAITWANVAQLYVAIWRHQAKIN